MNREKLKEEKFGELRKDIERIVKSAEAFGIPIAEIRRIVDEARTRRK